MLSKLLRFTLEMSSKESITFREEIEYLEAYLCFQQMRLGSKLNYKIDMENSFKSSAQEYLIPPMLIQPLIENEIIHGIGPLKDNNGCVTLQINKSADYLNVKVTDNGFG